jgi:ADP-ribosyl-[dinitrogen reductase] hydrolase
MTMTHIRTSLSDPLRIAEVRHECFPGVLGITFCPGKKQNYASTGAWDRDLAIDLDVVKHWGAVTVISLIEDHEIADLGVSRLGAEVTARGMKWFHLPIVDISTPDDRFKTRWMDARNRVLDSLRIGDRIVVHCKGGLGRAGMVSALIMVELGVSPASAVSIVRAARPGAIETRAQEEYVLKSNSVS